MCVKSSFEEEVKLVLSRQSKKNKLKYTHLPLVVSANHMTGSFCSADTRSEVNVLHSDGLHRPVEELYCHDGYNSMCDVMMMSDHHGP